MRGKAASCHGDEEALIASTCSRSDSSVQEGFTDELLTAAVDDGAPQTQQPVVASEERWSDKAKMWASLVALTLQTTGQVLLVKWARSATAAEGGAKYLNSTIVLFVELVKTAASLFLVVLESGGVTQASESLHQHFVQDPRGLLMAAVPAVIYTVQTNLNLYSLEMLSAAVQQVLYQMKIITTAALGGLMLGKTLTRTKWTACFMLAAGVMMVQWPRPTADHDRGEVDVRPRSWQEAVFGGLSSNQMLGFLAVLTTSITSGFNSVYIEKMLQHSSASLWMRNVQLGLFGSVVAAVVISFEDGAEVREGGLLQGYTFRVWLVVLMSSLGGLLCAVMLKYAGATLGCFSTATSIILTCTLSATVMKDFEPDVLFVVGTLLAISASLLWSLGFPHWLSSNGA